ncbi:hypothetical protein LFWB_6930 [Candidatus Phytoplasma luffae]|uniref:Uncharacterized protein n=1 Tax=Loofah witches'-broom phytoplasma TaxID=35773 RepID=A0A975INT4_LOWBP|nr:ECF transporter S component [Candidatus Phytoplasma luffae]QTX03246.1 hypothetical protein LFWB_6930 [Candidatus Phytoplasma luffae]
MKKFLLQKIIIISFFLSISFITEILLTKFILQSHNCANSLLKLELLPLYLIGFLVGFKYSFFANLLYTIIHIIFESGYSWSFTNLLSGKEKGYIYFLFFFFIIPYLTCSLTGLFRSCDKKKLKSLYKNKDIFKSMIIITIIQIFSYALFISLFYNKESFDSIIHKNEYHHDHEEHEKEHSIFSIPDTGKGLFLYQMLAVCLNNLIIGVILYFIKYILKDNIEYFDLE